MIIVLVAAIMLLVWSVNPNGSTSDAVVRTLTTTLFVFMYVWHQHNVYCWYSPKGRYAEALNSVVLPASAAFVSAMLDFPFDSGSTKLGAKYLLCLIVFFGAYLFAIKGAMAGLAGQLQAPEAERKLLMWNMSADPDIGYFSTFSLYALAAILVAIFM